MSDIIDRAESLSLEKAVSIAQVRSQAGRRSAQKRGPTLYNLEAEVPAQRMNGTAHMSIEDEIISLEYGAKTFSQASIQGVFKVDTITKPRGTWIGTPIINGASQTGNTVVVTNITGTVVAGDYVQFSGSTKVYQLKAGSTNTSLVLNCPLVASPTDASAVVFGNNVNFNFALKEMPSTQFLPGNIVQFGKFLFEEVIE
tara:strand:- start:14 stop:610 length:597 start_codon:yes stop_codon:yes gene_type:complete